MRAIRCECGAIVGKEIAKTDRSVPGGKRFCREYNENAARYVKGPERGFVIAKKRSDIVYCVECARKNGFM